MQSKQARDRRRAQRRMIEHNERVRANEIERKRSMPPEIKLERDEDRHRLTRKADRMLGAEPITDPSHTIRRSVRDRMQSKANWRRKLAREQREADAERAVPPISSIIVKCPRCKNNYWQGGGHECRHPIGLVRSRNGGRQ
jgi:hypothetical protein